MSGSMGSCFSEAMLSCGLTSGLTLAWGIPPWPP